MAGALVFTDICRLTDERQKLTVYREGGDEIIKSVLKTANL